MPEKIIERNSSEQFRDDYTRYGIYIMYRRVVSDFRDGLKPVQRRILYAMYHDIHCTSFGSKCKSAAVVGEVLKSYHPHGDAAVYNTIKPMTNWFEINMPLVGQKGNFGTFQGNPPAAPRYTECYLSEFAVDAIFRDMAVSDKSVDWAENYGRNKMEPEYLPVAVPLLLINGSFGIGLGMKVEIPSHNINEVIDATLNLIANPNASVTLAPDHCMPCDIYDTDFEKISRMGFGHYKVRGHIVQEQYKGKTALVITSLPDLTYLDSISDKIDELVASKKIIQIENCFDESDTNLRYVIILKHGADPNYVRDVIYKNTDMEQTLRVNFETLDGLNPMRMSYKSYLQAFIEFRKLTKFRVYINDLQKVQTKIHEKEAYIKVLESGQIDQIIQMIRKQRTIDDNATMEHLIKTLNITDLQAQYILGADIRKLSYGYLAKYKAESVELNIQKATLEAKINNDNLILQDIVDELNYFKAKYGKRRRCRIVRDDNDDGIPKGEMKIVITDKNFIKKVPANDNIGVFRGDLVKKVIRVDNTENILVFDDQGKVFKLPVHTIPFSDKVSNGTDIRYMIKGLTSNVNTVVPESLISRLDEAGIGENRHYVITATKLGLIKRMDLGDFTTVPISGIRYCKVDPGDFVKDVIIAHISMDLILYSDKKAIRINVGDIAYLKRNTKGSKAMSSSDGIDGMCVINNTSTDILVVTEFGKINRLDICALPTTGKSRAGFNVVKLAKEDKINTILAVNAADTIKVVTMANRYEFVVNSIPQGSSISSGEKLVPMRGDNIIRVEHFKVR